ncbi:hypothetical protein STEG23_032652 [Scotinomys teguina]
MNQFLFEYSIAQIPFICGEQEYVAACKHEKPNSHVHGKLHGFAFFSRKPGSSRKHKAQVLHTNWTEQAVAVIGYEKASQEYPLNTA